MRTIGLLGGMSWESTAVYYRLLNEAVRARRGKLHSAPVILHSVDFQPLAEMQAAGDWDAAGRMLAGAAAGLERAGAGLVAIATNTMHKVAPAIQAATALPLVHIADATAAAVRAAGLRRVGLLATRFTMEQDFYTGRLAAAGVEALVPDAGDRAEVHRVIYEELCRGEVRAGSRAAYQAVAARLKARGAEGIVLGCTEIGLLLRPGDLDLPMFDTTPIHAEAIVDAALG